MFQFPTFVWDHYFGSERDYLQPVLPGMKIPGTLIHFLNILNIFIS